MDQAPTETATRVVFPRRGISLSLCLSVAKIFSGSRQYQGSSLRLVSRWSTPSSNMAVVEVVPHIPAAPVAVNQGACQLYIKVLEGAPSRNSFPGDLLFPNFAHFPSVTVVLYAFPHSNVLHISFFAQRVV